MAKSLIHDENLTAAQRDYVAGLPREKPKAGTALHSVFFAAGFLACGAVFCIKAVRPDLVGKNAINLAVFFGWADVVLAMMMPLLAAFLILGIGWLATEENKLEDYRRLAKSVIVGFRDRNLISRACGVPYAAGYIATIVGLASLGYILLPIALFSAWIVCKVTKAVLRTFAFGLVEDLCPSQPKAVAV